MADMSAMFDTADMFDVSSRSLVGTKDRNTYLNRMIVVGGNGLWRARPNSRGSHTWPHRSIGGSHTDPSGDHTPTYRIHRGIAHRFIGGSHTDPSGDHTPNHGGSHTGRIAKLLELQVKMSPRIGLTYLTS